jgi:protein required for attachment to host cells
MQAHWIVAANAGRARFFSQANATEPLLEIHDMVNTAARLRTGETESDALGQRAASKSRHSVGAPTQPSGYEPHQTPAEHQTNIFAKTLAEFLAHAHQQGRFNRLSIVAAPEFLGVLRKLLEPSLASAVKLEINKDYTHFNARQLHERIEAHEAKR